MEPEPIIEPPPPVELLQLPSVEAPPPTGETLFDSVILHDFLDFFNDLRGKHVPLLWRGTRDGFGAVSFHDRCDGHPNTITAILDTSGNLFGGFTPIPWESDCKAKGDKTLTSYIFSLRNPEGIPPRRFPLSPEKSRYALFCYSGYGPSFGFPDTNDFRVSDHCDVQTRIKARNSYCGSFGLAYSNEDRLGQPDEPGLNTFLTGAPYFTVKEIEVFEVFD
jgi:hypothetical protein